METDCVNKLISSILPMLINPSKILLGTRSNGSIGSNHPSLCGQMGVQINLEITPPGLLHKSTHISSTVHRDVECLETDIVSSRLYEIDL